MNQVIHINFHGRVVPIEVAAFDSLKKYTDSLSAFFANEVGREEIINDIESRIAELFQERLNKGATCITDEDVNAVIKSMGRPEEFDNEEGAQSVKQEGAHETSNKIEESIPKRFYRDEQNKVIGGVCSGLANYFGTDPVLIRVIFAVIALAFGTGMLAYLILWIAAPSSASNQIGGLRKKLFRNPDNKILAGVCSGIGNYFGISPWIPRALFLIPFITVAFNHDWGIFDLFSLIGFSFSPGSLIVYIILWLAIPEASNTAEKLEMKGEKVDMNSIKNSVMEEMRGVQKRAEKLAREASSAAGEKGAALGSEINTVARKGGRSLGDIIIFLVKAFAYFSIGIVVLTLVVVLFSVAVGAIALFPLKNFIVTDGWQNIFAWGTLIFFIAVPVIGIITWIIRLFAKIKANRKILRISFVCLWIIGWVCFIGLIGSTARDFRSINNPFEQEVVLNNPTVNKLHLTTTDGMLQMHNSNNFLRIDPFEGLEEDTALIRNVEVNIRQSANDSFRVTMIKLANGRSRRAADTLASLISYKALQQDSLLILDKGIAINKQDKFRNQRVIVTVYVPVGKQIRVDGNIGWGNTIHIGGLWNGDNWDMNDDEKSWRENTDYMMKADGLYTLDGKPVSDWESRKDDHFRWDEKGIEIMNDGNRIQIDENGILIEEDSSDSRTFNSRSLNKIDSMMQHLREEKKRLRDSIRKSMEEFRDPVSVNINNASASSNLTASSYLMPIFMNL